MITTYERGKLAGQLEFALALLEAKFGQLLAGVTQRIEAMAPDELRP